MEEQLPLCLAHISSQKAGWPTAVVLEKLMTPRRQFGHMAHDIKKTTMLFNFINTNIIQGSDYATNLP
jgi:hypothetical protein